jgi:hypothetical protein
LESSDGGAIPSLALAAVDRPRARDGDESRGGRPDWMAAPPLGTTPARFPTLVRSAASPARPCCNSGRCRRWSATTAVEVDGGPSSAAACVRPPPPRVVRPVGGQGFLMWAWRCGLRRALHDGGRPVRPRPIGCERSPPCRPHRSMPLRAAAPVDLSRRMALQGTGAELLPMDAGKRHIGGGTGPPGCLLSTR